MNDYIRRTVKFILYMAIIFVLVLVVFPIMTGEKTPAVSWNEFAHNPRFIGFMGLLLAYSFVYPLITFTKIRRHLNGTFADNRELFEKAFDTFQYIKIEETPDKIVYRRKSKFARFAQWYEDRVVLDITENPVIISGSRKSIVRIDKLIDHLLIKSSE